MKTVLFSLLVTSSIVLSAQIGRTFPGLQGKTLNNESITLPAKDKKYTVLAIAFHRQAEEDLKKWLNPLITTFIKDQNEASKGIDLADVYDVNFIFIPMINGFQRFADEFKKDTDPRLWQYIMDTEKTDISLVQKSLSIEDNKVPYFFVLNASGTVVQVQSGKYSPAKIDKLEDAIE
jgi:hypothetical protein